MMKLSAAGLTRARGAFILTVGFIVLLSSAVWLYWTVKGTINYQRDVRLAQAARDSVFRALLDQETSMRGFTSTRQITFLMPYGRSQERMDAAFADLSFQLKRVGATKLLGVVDTEIALYRRWHETVAAPLLAAPRRPDATRLQYVGKSLIDDFRNADLRINDGINEAASAADASLNIAVIRIAIVTGFFGMAFAFAYYFFAAQRSKMTAETARQRLLYENEKRIADALQGAFMQKALPVLPNLGFHASYIPARAEAQVGGDWYDAFVLPDGRILFSIGDVAGHGVEAAVIMSRARQAIISSALHERDPAVVLSKANESLMLQETKMVTAICGYIEPESLRIDYATAGHPPPILAFPNGEARFLEHDGLPLGIMAGVQHRSFTAYAREGALLVLYTDGVMEHKRDLISGERRLLEAARRAAAGHSGNPAAAVRKAIFGDTPPEDDVAIMTVSFAMVDHANAAVAGTSHGSVAAAR